MASSLPTLLGPLTVVLLTAIPARAVEFKHSEGPFVPVHHCTCRFNGEDVELGERRCIVTPQGSRAAICEMQQNVTSWRASDEGCPQASLVVPRG